MSKTDKIILGLDPGFADTGWGVVLKNNNSLKFIDTGSIQTTKKTDFFKRLQIIYQEVNKLIKKHKPDIVAVGDIGATDISSQASLRRFFKGRNRYLDFCKFRECTGRDLFDIGFPIRQSSPAVDKCPFKLTIVKRFFIEV